MTQLIRFRRHWFDTFGGMNMSFSRLLFAITLISVAMLTVACDSSENKPASEGPASAPVKKEPALYTGQQAFNQMTGLALKWSPDAQPARLESVLNSESNGQDGKSTVWRGYFVSANRHGTETIVCSGSRLPDAPPYGVSVEGGEGAYNAQSASLMFLGLLLKTDTDEAYKIAQQHGGEAILKKDPQQPVTYVLLKEPKHNVPVWYVIYGSSEKDRKGIGVINATTGAFVSAGK
jgi:hypothetical protein